MINVAHIRVVDVLYRVSTRAQEAEGESLFNQRRSVEDQWATPHNITIRRRIEVTESGKSALRLDNAGFRWDRRLEYAGLLSEYQRVGSERPDAVCVDWCDRWSRNPLEYLGIIQAFRSLGIRLIAVGDQLDLTDVRNDLLGTIRAGVAQEQLRITSEKVKESRRSRRERGKWQGGCPPDGYRTHTPECPGVVRVERESADGAMRSFFARACSCDVTTLRRDPKREATITQIWRLLEISPLSWQAVTDQLNKLGHRRPNGKEWTFNDLYRLGENPVYCGILATERWIRDSYDGRIKRRQPLNNQHLMKTDSIRDPYIDEATFWAVQVKRFGRQTRHLRRGANGSVSELSNVLSCPECAGRMVASISISAKLCGSGVPRKSPRKRYVYMRCIAASTRMPSCKNRQRIRASVVSALIIQELARTVQMSDDAIANALSLRRSESVLRSLELEQSRLDKQLTDIDTARHHLTKLLISGAITQPEVERELFLHRQDRSAAQERLEEIERELRTHHARPDFTQARETVRWLAQRWAELTVVERAEALGILVTRCTYILNGSTIVEEVRLISFGPSFVESPHVSLPRRSQSKTTVLR